MKISYFLCTTAISVILATQFNSAALAKTALDVEFARTNLMLADNMVLDPVHLSILERHFQFVEPIKFETYNAHLRCKPLKGLKKATYSCVMSTFEGKGYEDLMQFKRNNVKKDKPDFLAEVNQMSFDRFRKLGIDANFSDRETDTPHLAMYVLLVKKDPQLSSVTLELSEKVSSKRTPDQADYMPTFQIELFGDNSISQGKAPMDLVKAVLDRFEYWWRFANKDKIDAPSSSPSVETSETPILTKRNLLKLAEAIEKDSEFLAKHSVQFQNLPFDHTDPNPVIYSIAFYGGDLNYFSSTFLQYHIDGTYNYEFEEFTKGQPRKKTVVLRMSETEANKIIDGRYFSGEKREKKEKLLGLIKAI